MQPHFAQKDLPLQFTSLRSFQPLQALQPHLNPGYYTRRRVQVRTVSESSSGLGVLQNAEVFRPPPLDVETAVADAISNIEVPPYQEWHNHLDLLQGCEPHAAPLNIAVLLSGGVDSSLALHLLRAAGHTVTAFYLQIWFQEDFRNFWDACPWEEDLGYCREVCDRLGVPLEVIPLSNEYWDRVVSHSIGEIKAGRTPNPDMLCNSRVKFGAFFEYLETHPETRFDRIASGHYAKVVRHSSSSQSSAVALIDTTTTEHNNSKSGSAENGVLVAGSGSVDAIAHLALTPDAIKDQTYFLAHLSQHQLSKVLFPLGHLTKPEVRALAAAADLPNSSRKDSQGICFLGKVRFSEFVKEHLGEWPGPLIEEETNEVVGYHKGFWFHTLGQRKGIFLSGGPWYVSRKDPNTNTVYVSRNYHEGEVTLRRSSFKCSYFNWNSELRPDFSQPLNCKVRHGPKLYTCTLTIEQQGNKPLIPNPNDENDHSKVDISNTDVGTVVLDGIDQGLAAGQYAAFYQNGYCLGCAVITG